MLNEFAASQTACYNPLIMQDILRLTDVRNLVLGIEDNPTEPASKRIEPKAMSYRRVREYVHLVREERELPVDLFTIFTGKDEHDDLYIIGPGKKDTTPTLLTRDELTDPFKKLPKIKLKMADQFIRISVEYRVPAQNGPAFGMHLVDSGDWTEISDKLQFTSDDNHTIFATLPITNSVLKGSRHNMLIFSVDSHPIIAIGSDLTDFDGIGKKVPIAAITLSRHLYSNV